MLVFPLKRQWYEKIKSGEKTVEYREVKHYWIRRVFTEIYKYTESDFLNFSDCYRNFENFCQINSIGLVVCSEDNIPGKNIKIILPCKLRRAYTSEYLIADITKIEIMGGTDTDLHINKPVFAFHLKNIKEVKQ